MCFVEPNLFSSFNEPPLELILLLELPSPLRLLPNDVNGASARADGKEALVGIDCDGFRHLK